MNDTTDLATLVDLRSVLVVTLLTLASGLGMLLWGIASDQAYVVILGVAIAAVAGMGWFLESVAAKRIVRGIA